MALPQLKLQPSVRLHSPLRDVSTFSETDIPADRPLYIITPGQEFAAMIPPGPFPGHSTSSLPSFKLFCHYHQLHTALLSGVDFFLESASAESRARIGRHILPTPPFTCLFAFWFFLLWRCHPNLPLPECRRPGLHRLTCRVPFAEFVQLPVRSLPPPAGLCGGPPRAVAPAVAVRGHGHAQGGPVIPETLWVVGGGQSRGRG